MTITEALAEIKTIGKRLETKRNGVLQYLYSQHFIRDPMDKEGGSRAWIVRERQAIADLEKRVVALREGIAAANRATEITVGGVTRSIQEWLTWRREVAPAARQFLLTICQKVEGGRNEAIRKGVAVAAGEEAGRNDLVINVDEAALVAELEWYDTTLGDLDGQLSLKNATVPVAV